ncbi:MAG: RNA polymerase sigma factor [Ignavibacteriae bacterium]|nr:RNA polymerase sigma factor [Ignavibacteriota bacterium]NOH00086.1 RNA polymerase sigma factor [Ignavibacteriota bacterium]
MKKNSRHYSNFSKAELDKLLQGAKAGDNHKFNSLSSSIREISHSYYYSKYKLGKIQSEDDVDDLCQNLFLSFAKQYQNIENIENWLRRVLFLTYANWYKKSSKNKNFEFDESFYQQDEAEDITERADHETIVNMLNSLDEKKQQIIKLRFWGGLKFSEIAEKLDGNEAAIKKMFYRTLMSLKKKL